MAERREKKKLILNWKTGYCYLCDQQCEGRLGLFSHTIRSKTHKQKLHKYHQEINEPCHLCPKTGKKADNKEISVYTHPKRRMGAHQKHIEDFC